MFCRGGRSFFFAVYTRPAKTEVECLPKRTVALINY